MASSNPYLKNKELLPPGYRNPPTRPDDSRHPPPAARDTPPRPFNDDHGGYWPSNRPRPYNAGPPHPPPPHGHYGKPGERPQGGLPQYDPISVPLEDRFYRPLTGGYNPRMAPDYRGYDRGYERGPYEPRYYEHRGPPGGPADKYGGPPYARHPPPFAPGPYRPEEYGPPSRMPPQRPYGYPDPHSRVNEPYPYERGFPHEGGPPQKPPIYGPQGGHPYLDRRGKDFERPYPGYPQERYGPPPPGDQRPREPKEFEPRGERYPQHYADRYPYPQGRGPQEPPPPPYGRYPPPGYGPQGYDPRNVGHHPELHHDIRRPPQDARPAFGRPHGDYGHERRVYSPQPDRRRVDDFSSPQDRIKKD